MIKGILFLETGEVQVIGVVQSARNIIEAMQQVLPDLVRQEKARVEKERLVETLTAEQIAELLKQQTGE